MEAGERIIVLPLDDWRWLGDSAAQDVALDEIGEPSFCLVGKEFCGRDREDLCRKEKTNVSESYMNQSIKRPGVESMLVITVDFFENELSFLFTAQLSSQTLVTPTQALVLSKSWSLSRLCSSSIPRAEEP